MGLSKLSSGGGTNDGARTESNFTPSAVGSISYWLKPSNLSGNHRCVGSGNMFELRIVGTAAHNEYGKDTASETVTLSVNTLVHFAATWETVTTETGNVYLDGVFQDSDTGYNDIEPAQDLEMFSRYGSGDYFLGGLHDIRIYNRVLSAAEILTIYNSRGKDSIVHGMIHRWVLDEGADGTTFSGLGTGKDRASGGNNFDADDGPPDYVYDADITPRRRAS